MYMIGVVTGNLQKNFDVLSPFVCWTSRKYFMETIYTFPSSIRINNYQVFKLSDKYRAYIEVKSTSRYEHWEMVRLLNHDASPVSVCVKTAQKISTTDMNATGTPLCEVTSSHHGNLRAQLQNISLAVTVRTTKPLQQGTPEMGRT